MIYRSAKLQLKSIRVILRNQVNEVEVCQNLSDSARGLFVVISVKDHEVVRRFLEVYEKSPSGTEQSMVECFANEGRHLIVFPYVKERPLGSFYRPGALSLQECEEICVNLVISVMTSSLPWPLLYLVLCQNQLHLSKDRNVYLGYAIDLTELDGKVQEQDCVNECARILLRLLEPKARQKATSYQLLE